MGRRPLTPEELAEAEERQQVLMQAFPSARSDVLPVTVDDGPPVSRVVGAPPPMVGTRPQPGSYAYKEGEETREEHAARVAEQYADQVGADPLDELTLPAPGPLSAPLQTQQGPQLLQQDARQLLLSMDPRAELEAIRNRPPPDYRQTADRVMADGGARPNFMGYEDEGGFSRDQRIAEAGALYDQHQAANPYERRGGNWEDEFLKRNQADQERMHRAFVLQSLMGGQEQGYKHREMMQREVDAREEGLRRARELSQGGDPNAPISRALAEAIAGAGLASPAAAVQLRAGDPLVKAFTSGGYSQGLRAEGQQLGLTKSREGNLTQLSIADQNRLAMLERTVLGGTLAGQNALANRGLAAGDLSAGTVTNADIVAASLSEELGLPLATTRRVVQGDMSGVPPEQREAAEKALIRARGGVTEKGGRTKLALEPAANQGQRGMKLAAAIELAVGKAATDPEYRTKMETGLATQRIELVDAIKAWNSMSPGGREAFVQWAPNGIPASLGNFISRLKEGQTANENDRAKATALWTLFNSIIQARTGAAAPQHEFGRIANELGLANGSWDPFNSVKGTEATLNQMARKLNEHEKIYKTNIKDWGKR